MKKPIFRTLSLFSVNLPKFAIAVCIDLGEVLLDCCSFSGRLISDNQIFYRSGSGFWSMVYDCTIVHSLLTTIDSRFFVLFRRRRQNEPKISTHKTFCVLIRQSLCLHFWRRKGCSLLSDASLIAFLISKSKKKAQFRSFGPSSKMTKSKIRLVSKIRFTNVPFIMDIQKFVSGVSILSIYWLIKAIWFDLLIIFIHLFM